MRFNTLRITTYIGLGFLVLGCLNGSNVAEISPQFYFSISLAGFLFILFDFASNEEEQERSTRKKLIFNKISKAALFLSILSIVVLPYTPLPISADLMQRVNDTLVLIGLGLVIITIGYRDLYTTFNYVKTNVEHTKQLGEHIKILNDRIDALAEKKKEQTEQKEQEKSKEA